MTTALEVLASTWKRFQAGEASAEHLDTAIKDLTDPDVQLRVVLVGNLNDGFEILGPYTSFDEAAEEAKDHASESWISRLYRTAEETG